jgi:glycosyltransferase involved in cell wall biosynthesis
MARIAFIDVTVTVSYGGVQTACWRLADALARAGHEVAMFGGEGAIRPANLHPNIKVHTFPFRPREKVIDLGSRFQRIVERATHARHARHAFAAGGYDRAILTKPFDFYWPWILPKDCKTKFCFMSGGTDFYAGDRFLSRRVNAWTACSHFNAWQIHARYKRWPKVIYNGVETDKFTPGVRDDSLRARLGVAPDAVLFAFAGRLVGWKGMAVALKALAEPALREANAKLLIVGDGSQKPELQQLAQSLGVANRVMFHDPVPHDRLPALYGAVDAGVFPSIGDEAFGIAIAEAMSCGKPVIASHIGGIPEVVGNEESCGLLVAPGDPAVLAAAMRRLADDAALRTQLGAAARARIERLYTWDMSAQRLLNALGLAD